MKICITGLVGSGKTTIINYLKSIDQDVYIADEYIHKIYRKGKKGYKLIRKHFGNKYVNNLEVDRKKLGKKVFNDVNSLNKLNDLTLPLIRKWIKKIKCNKKNVFIELGIYLNHVEYFQSCFDLVVLIKGQKKIQNKKINSLGWYKTKINKNPIKINEFNNYIIIDNNSSITNLEKKIKNKLSKYIKI